MFEVQFNELWTVDRRPWTSLPHLIALCEGLPSRPHTLQEQASTKFFQIRSQYFWVLGRHLVDMRDHVAGTEAKVL